MVVILCNLFSDLMTFLVGGGEANQSSRDLAEEHAGVKMHHQMVLSTIG